jgi:hypothetical protein
VGASEERLKKQAGRIAGWSGVGGERKRMHSFYYLFDEDFILLFVFCFLSFSLIFLSVGFLLSTCVLLCRCGV